MPSYGSQQVYVIQHELGPVKIGRAKNPRERLGNLQISSPFKLTLKQTVTPNDAKEVEEYLHHHFQKYHMRGEWFDIPKKERDFDIPTRITDSGRADSTVEITPERDINTEWAEVLNRLFIAMKVTKYETAEIKALRKQVRKIGDIDEKTESDKGTDEGINLHSVQEDTHSSKIRCPQCGHHYDRTESECPTCGGGSVVDNRRR